MLSPSERFFLDRVNDCTLTVTKAGVVINNKTGRQIGATGSGGYPKISMSENGRKGPIRHIQIHRLVWIVYKGPIPFHLEVNHKDKDKENPALLNLELKTATENRKHHYLTGGCYGMKGNANHQSKIPETDIPSLRKRWKNGKLNVKETAARYGVSKTSLYLMLNYETYIHLD